MFELNDIDEPTKSLGFADDIWTLQTSQIGSAPVEGDTVSDTAGANSSLEEPSRGSGIAALRQHEIKGLPVPIYSTVQPKRPDSTAGLVIHQRALGAKHPTRSYEPFGRQRGPLVKHDE